MRGIRGKPSAQAFRRTQGWQPAQSARSASQHRWCLGLTEVVRCAAERDAAPGRERAGASPARLPSSIASARVGVSVRVGLARRKVIPSSDRALDADLGLRGPHRSACILRARRIAVGRAEGRIGAVRRLARTWMRDMPARQALALVCFMCRLLARKADVELQSVQRMSAWQGQEVMPEVYWLPSRNPEVRLRTMQWLPTRKETASLPDM
mmetsp:Transcript_13402/g.27015  ORF Transcript_13402/g.27015 Transcript_13402/m.27015 type:complete len:210 (-) Transcript_13402:161-790(-)